MQRAQFAQILADRRRQLRLSIPQAARVLRMRESVLEAFEMGDFDHLPALGYAQGMVASYARYLGLDPRHITELYEREHAEYVTGVTGREPSGLARLADEPSIDGPTSATGAARSTSTGLAPTRGSGSGYGPSASAGSYGQPREGAQGVYNPRGSYGTNYSSGGYGSSYSDRRYTTRNPNSDEERERRQQQAGRVRRSYDAYGDERRDRSDARGGSSQRGRAPRDAAGHDGDIQTRRIDSGQYHDDLRFGSDARPYRPSSTRAGRAGSRPGGAPVRPNVRRQSPDRNRDPRNRGRRPQPPRKGIAGVIDRLNADPRRAITLMFALVAILLVVIIIFSVRSCASSKSDNSKVNVVTAVTSEAASTSATTTSAVEQQALSEAAAKKAASQAAAQAQETKVTVTVAEGSTTWVEITCDGEQMVAESVTGAWSQEYTPKKSLEIRVGDPSVVTVEKNGERQTFSGKSAGTASLTIEGTDPAAAATASTTAAADASGDSGDTSSE